MKGEGLLIFINFNLSKDIFWVKQFWINLVWSKIALTNHKDLSGLCTRCLWFGGVDFLKELLEDPHQSLVVLGPEHLGNEPSSLLEEFTSQF
jgi:hypothetical protein